jgi:hypothetical protein
MKADYLISGISAIDAFDDCLGIRYGRGSANTAPHT